MKTVKITAHPTTGVVFTQMKNADGSAKLDKNGKEFGFIRVEQAKISLGFAYNNGGVKRRSALISMTTEAWEKSKSLLLNGATADGQIVRKDALTPFYEGQKPLQAPKKDAQGNVIEGEFNTITSGGQPVYRNEFFTESQSDTDVPMESYDKIEAVVAAPATVLAEN